MKKKFISIFTIICMLAVCMPSLVFANDGIIPDEQVTEEVTELEEEQVALNEEPEAEVSSNKGIELSGRKDKQDNNNGHYTIHISVSGNGQLNINDKEGRYATYDTDINNPNIKYNELEAFVISKYPEKNIESVEFSNLKVTGNGNNTSIHLDAKIKEKPIKYNIVIHYVADEDTTVKLRDDYVDEYVYEDTKETVYNTDTFEGRELVNEDDASITYTKTDNHEFTVRYKLKDVDAIIHYVDVDTKKEIAKAYEETFKYGQTLEEASPTLEGYELVNASDEVVTNEMKDNYEHTVYYKMVTPEDPKDEPNIDKKDTSTVTPEDPATPEDSTDPEGVIGNVVIHSTSPQTGDGYELVLWSGATLLAVLLIYYLVAKRKY